LGYLIAGAVAITVSQLHPDLPGLAGWRSLTAMYLLVNASAVGAIGLGIHRHRPAQAQALAWVLVLANQAVYLGGDFLFYVGRYGWHWTSYPAPADAFYLGHYPLLAAGLIVMVHRRGRLSRLRLADGLLAGVGFAVLSWALLIAPSASAPGSLLAKATSAAYPAFDLVIFLIGLQLLFGGQRKTGSVKLLVFALVLLFGTDNVYAWMQLHGDYDVQRFLDIMWLSYYVILGASALHPSMSERAGPPAERAGSRARYAVLFALTLITPSVALYQAIQGDRSADLPIAVGSLVLFVLVGLRMLGLIAHQWGLLDELRRTQADRATLLRQTVDAAEREQARLAADLHDGPIQHLASIAYTLDGALLTYASGDASTATDLLGGAREKLGEVVGGLRRIMTGLRPAVLDHGGLAAAIEYCAREFQTRTGIAATVNCRLSKGHLALYDETVLFRVCQEALTNVAKHSSATAVQVRLGSGSDGTVELSVADDGVGLDTRSVSELVQQGHFGLAGMRERAEAAGGCWEVRSSPGNGTEIVARIPSGHLAAPLGSGPVRDETSGTYAVSSSR
jgi:signal transduction histidine kinase